LISVRAKVFRLNDIPLELKGACMHHDNGLLGSALSTAQKKDGLNNESQGYNAIRTSHNPLRTISGRLRPDWNACNR